MRCSQPAGKTHRLKYLTVKDVPLDIEHGESVGEIGSSGAGKSTTLKKLSVILTHTEEIYLNGYMSVAKHFFEITENISYQVAAGKISKELLHRILTAIMLNTYDGDEELKLEIFNAIS